MFTFLVVLILITSVMLIAAVLIQNSKKEGFTHPLGATSQLLGVKKTNDLLEQFTWGLVISLLVLSLGTSIFLKKQDRSGMFPSSPNMKRAKDGHMLPDESEKALPGSQ